MRCPGSSLLVDGPRGVVDLPSHCPSCARPVFLRPDNGPEPLRPYQSYGPTSRYRVPGHQIVSRVDTTPTQKVTSPDMSDAYMNSLNNRVIFRKVCNVGTVPDVTPGGKSARLFLTIELCKGQQDPTQVELSITGVLGPKANGDAWGGCGQNREDLLLIPSTHFTTGWDRSLAERTYEIWERWHLNGMFAGSLAQQDWLRKHAAEFPGYPTSHYDWASEGLAAAGLNPDPNYLVPSKDTTTVPYEYGRAGRMQIQHHPGEFKRPGELEPYKYGSAHLYEELPEDIIEFIKALPQSEVAHPWGRNG